MGVKAKDSIELVSDVDTRTLANGANNMASTTNQYFWHTVSGDDPGTHITEVPMEDFVENPVGGNTLITNEGIILRDGKNETAKFIGGNNPYTQLGKNTEPKIIIKPSEINMKNFDDGDIFKVSSTNRSFLIRNPVYYRIDPNMVEDPQEQQIESVIGWRSESSGWEVGEGKSCSPEEYGIYMESLQPIATTFDTSELISICDKDRGIVKQINGINFYLSISPRKQSDTSMLIGFGQNSLEWIPSIVTNAGSYNDELIDRSITVKRDSPTSTNWYISSRSIEKYEKIMSDLNNRCISLNINWNTLWNSIQSQYTRIDVFLTIHFLNNFKLTTNNYYIGRQSSFEISDDDPLIFQYPYIYVDSGYMELRRGNIMIENINVEYRDSNGAIAKITALDGMYYLSFTYDTYRDGGNYFYRFGNGVSNEYFSELDYMNMIINRNVVGVDVTIGEGSSNLALACYEDEESEDHIDYKLMYDFYNLMIKNQVMPNSNQINLKQWMHEINKVVNKTRCVGDEYTSSKIKNITSHGIDNNLFLGATVEVPPGKYLCTGNWIFNTRANANVSCAHQLLLGCSVYSPDVDQNFLNNCIKYGVVRYIQPNGYYARATSVWTINTHDLDATYGESESYYLGVIGSVSITLPQTMSSPNTFIKAVRIG